ncbi:MAG: hypothetical protein WDN45_03020 [Caulobacteraceae bacterium]
MDWRGFNFEPVPWLYDELIGNRPLATNLKAALSNRNGHAEFTAYDHPVLGRSFGNGSLTHTEAHRRSLEESGCTPQTLATPRPIAAPSRESGCTPQTLEGSGDHLA